MNSDLEVKARYGYHVYRPECLVQVTTPTVSMWQRVAWTIGNILKWGLITGLVGGFGYEFYTLNPEAFLRGFIPAFAVSLGYGLFAAFQRR